MKIKLNSNDSNSRGFIATKNILINETLLLIPYNITININNTLDLLQSKKLIKQYNKYKSMNITYRPNPYDFRMEESFLAFIFYLIDKKPKIYNKTKFYEKFKYFINSFEDNLNRVPLFFDSDQISFFNRIHFSEPLKLSQIIYNDEIDIFSKNFYKDKIIDFDEYVLKRLFTINKGYNISNHNTLVPFIDLLKKDLTLNNTNYTIEKNNSVRVYATRPILKNEEIILSDKIMPNSNRLLLEGKTYEELIDVISEYYGIYAFSPEIKRKYGLEKYDLARYVIYLDEKDFVRYAIEIYKRFGDLLRIYKESGYYDILLENLEAYKKQFEFVPKKKVYETFYNSIDRINVERIIEGDKRILDNAINEVKKIIDENTKNKIDDL